MPSIFGLKRQPEGTLRRLHHRHSPSTSANLPPSAYDEERKQKAESQRQMMEFFDPKESKVKFKNETLNQILAVWILAGALPWSRIEDYHLRLAFRYIRSNIKIFGRTWVAREAAGMYTSLQDTVLKEILISCTVKGGLAKLGQTSPSRTQLRESTLGAFPITGKLPVIAEEDKDEGEEQPKVINIDTDESDHDLEVTPDEEDEYETDHDSQHEVILSAPEYDEDVKDNHDAEDPLESAAAPEPSGAECFKNTTSKQHTNKLNVLISKSGSISGLEATFREEGKGSQSQTVAFDSGLQRHMMERGI
ncbi:uncharacterized protein MELLADRAFT_64146 [Melampsora larici-populina 98AG31]|uniref:Uncharacterized protein n=1 Tax=Melampsora larici-populina (strain 98AG31 / pathotype 3-4-7) TaxID=747676 RepID=F4RQ68_MELLP|nr:uncharacterized protein MELLADRAFT_64146 [Melampsora larici-populina 98AG31]EGG05458.1 hypothetical protein MELLADRAFT_64146 [Melampsora larici-populina 98AG31]